MVGIVLPAALVVLTLMPLVLFRDRFPEPLATHWGARGRPNGSMTFPALVLFNLVFAGTPAALMALAARCAPAYRGEIFGLLTTPLKAFGSISPVTAC